MTAAALSTLADLTHSYRLYGVCNTCHRMERINLFKVSQVLGLGFPITRLKSKLRCDECDSRDCGIRIVWDGNG
jgi:hypothetical protein